jgi:hypothetical protein
LYNKLFTKILDSSIWLEDSDTRIVWITLLAVMDEQGFCRFAYPANVARRARVSPAAAVAALKKFEAPDPLSPEDDNEGRRIERVAGGYVVLNAGRYREQMTREEIRRQDAERARRYRERKRSVTPERDAVTEKRDAVMEATTDVTYPSRKQVRASVNAAAEQTLQEAKALLKKSKAVAAAPSSNSPTLDGDGKVAGSMGRDFAPEAQGKSVGEVHGADSGLEAGADRPSLFPRRGGEQVLPKPRYPPRIQWPTR